jgi:hypothetical protein
MRPRNFMILFILKWVLFKIFVHQFKNNIWVKIFLSKNWIQILISSLIFSGLANHSNQISWERVKLRERNIERKKRNIEENKWDDPNF